MPLVLLEIARHFVILCSLRVLNIFGLALTRRS